MLHILYFAQLKDQLNCREEEIQWQHQLNTIAAIKTHLSQRGSPWSNAFSMSIMTAVNHEIVKDHHPIKDEDEIAFFPPVTGG
jgi:molybdopterin synthase sulfur carrier subunit